jgi:hypothetical protein
MKKALVGMFPEAKKNIDRDCCSSCGRPIKLDDFRDTISIKEYGISGLCMLCQDLIWGNKNDEQDTRS